MLLALLSLLLPLLLFSSLVYFLVLRLFYVLFFLRLQQLVLDESLYALFLECCWLL